jgi:CorA-like Mg2+ transporter protein
MAKWNVFIKESHIVMKNETIRTLTVIATIVLPLILISGIYGMNFDICLNCVLHTDIIML